MKVNEESCLHEFAVCMCIFKSCLYDAFFVSAWKGQYYRCLLSCVMCWTEFAAVEREGARGASIGASIPSLLEWVASSATITH